MKNIPVFNIKESEDKSMSVLSVDLPEDFQYENEIMGMLVIPINEINQWSIPAIGYMETTAGMEGFPLTKEQAAILGEMSILLGMGHKDVKMLETASYPEATPTKLSPSVYKIGINSKAVEVIFSV